MNKVTPFDPLSPTITTPTNGATLPCNGGAFSAYGRSNNAADTTACVTYYGSGGLQGPIAGTAIPSASLPAGATWGFSFSGLPCPQLFTLTVTYTDSDGDHGTSIQFGLQGS
ncbi:MAG TPA: hypothetical protein VKA46_03440 [Gemmataceae bacterium]|nr:hypothetical protein [Gemmataceae bacterium]